MLTLYLRRATIGLSIPEMRSALLLGGNVHVVDDIGRFANQLNSRLRYAYEPHSETEPMDQDIAGDD